MSRLFARILNLPPRTRYSLMVYLWLAGWFGVWLAGAAAVLYCTGPHR